MRVCLVGLSADPPTHGHICMAKAIAKMNFFDEIRVLPVYRHTFQNKRERLTTFEHRMEMCRLAFQAKVSDAERQSWKYATRNMSEEERASTNVGTAALLDYLKVHEPENEFWMCLGADTYLDLTDRKWKESDRVLEHLKDKIVILNREGLISSAMVQERSPGAKLLDTVLPKVSSTQAREIKDEKELLKIVPASVIEYIKTQKLYSFGEDSYGHS